MRNAFLALAAGLLLSVPGFAEEFKIATVDLEKTFNSYYKTKIIDNDFLEQGNVYRNYIARQAETLRQEETEYRNVLDSSLNIALAPEERQKRQQEAAERERRLKTRRAELEQYAAERAKALQESAAAERKKVIGEIREEVRRRAAIEGYQLVLDSSGFSLNDTSLVLYSIPSIDITDKVIAELNRGAQSAGTPAKSEAKSEAPPKAEVRLKSEPEAKPEVKSTP